VAGETPGAGGCVAATGRGNSAGCSGPLCGIPPTFDMRDASAFGCESDGIGGFLYFEHGTTATLENVHIDGAKVDTYGKQLQQS
jgi:hypothetical protein